MNTARNLLLAVLTLNVAALNVVVIWHFAFIWQGSYNDEQVVLIDAVSAQLSIFALFLAAGAIGLAILSFWGYQTIRNFIAEEIRKSVDTSVAETVPEVLDGRGYKEKFESEMKDSAVKQKEEVR